MIGKKIGGHVSHLKQQYDRHFLDSARQGREKGRNIYNRRGKEKEWLDRIRMERRGRWKGRGIDFVSGMVENNLK